MPKYMGELTAKQREALEPLWERAEENRRKRSKLQRRINLEHLFFEESQNAHDEINLLDQEYVDICAQISEIYSVQEEIVKRMQAVLVEIKEIDKIAAEWGIDIYDKKKGA